MSPRITLFAALAAAIIGGITATAFTRPAPPAPEAPASFPLIKSIGSVAAGETSPPAHITELLNRHVKGKALDDQYARALLVPALVAADPTASVVLARKKTSLTSAVIKAFAIPEDHEKTARSLIDTKTIPAPEAAHHLAQLANGLDAAAILALQTSDSDAAASTLTSQLQETLKTDPQKAIIDAIAQVSPAKLESTLKKLFESWAKTDPAAAWDALILAPPTVDKGYIQREVIQEWFKKDPSKAANFLASEKISLERRALFDVARGLVELNPDRAIKWAEGALTPHSEALFDAVATQLGKTAPETFLSAIDKGFLQNSTDPKGTLEEFAESYADTHEEKALAWVSTYQGPHRTDIIGEIADKTAQKHPEATFDLIENSQLSPADLSTIVSQVEDLALHDLPRYLALFASASEEVAHKAISQAGEAFTEEGRYEDARELYSQTGLDNRAVDKQAQETITDWTEDNPAEAAGWVETIPPGSSRNFATQNLIDQWVRHDRDAALTYTRSLPEGSPERQHAALALAQRLAAGAPEESLAWLAELDATPDLQEQFLKSQEIDSLIYHAPDQLQQLFPENEALTQKIEADQAWRTYLRNYQPLPSDSRL